MMNEESSSTRFSITATDMQVNPSETSLRYKFEKWMSLKDCMSFLLAHIDVPDPMTGPMSCILSEVWKNATKFRDPLLIDYSDVFKSNIVLIVLNDSAPSDNNSILTFAKEEDYKHNIFLLYHEDQHVFAPYASCDNNIPKVCFDANDKEAVCKNISSSVVKWNNSISTKRKNEEKKVLANESPLKEQTRESPSIEDAEQRFVSGTDQASFITNVNHLILPMEENLPQTTNLKSDAPHVLQQPSRYQGPDLFSKLAIGTYPLIQADGTVAGEQTRVEIKVPPPNGTDLYVRLRAVTVGGKKQPYKAVVPKNPKIHTYNDKICLKYDRNQYNSTEQYTYLRITPEERQEGKKKIEAHLIYWSHRGDAFKNNKIRQYYSLCRLEFCLSIRTDPGHYQRVSPIFYSSVIEEGEGPVTIDETAVQIRNVCERGGQTIEFLLSVKCFKSDIVIFYNDKRLAKENIKLNGKKLRVITPAREGDEQNLILKISRNEYDDIEEVFSDRILFHRAFNYVSHDDDTLDLHDCAEQKPSSVKN